MRKLLVLRGAPGSGKTTWIKNNKLIPYTLSFDNIKMLYQSPIQTIYGKESTSQKLNHKVWDTLCEILEQRMDTGEFTIIDAINNKVSVLERFYELAQLYRYEMFVVDFTKIPIHVAKSQNINRSSRKRVPDPVIDSVYEDFKNEPVPDYMRIIIQKELSKVFTKSVDLSKYKKVHHIGDIHGCFEVFMEALNKNGGFKKDEYYIFLGDYTDKGMSNDKVLKFLTKLSEKNNVCFCEGNHERWMWNWLNNKEDCKYPDEFINNTIPQVSKLNMEKLKTFYKNLKECFLYSYKGRTVLACHGGLATIPERLEYISGYQYTHGVGLYSDLETIAKTFKKTTEKNMYEVFGHRNPEGFPTQLENRTFCLENGVDIGGNLRWLTLDKTDFHEKQYKNTFVREDLIESCDD